MAPALIKKKGIALIVTFGIMLVVSILALAVINLMSSQVKVTDRHIRRRIATAAAQAGIVHAYEMLRQGVYSPPLTDTIDVNGLSVNICVLGRPASGTVTDAHCNHTPSCTSSAPSPYCIQAYLDY